MGTSDPSRPTLEAVILPLVPLRYLSFSKPRLSALLANVHDSPPILHRLRRRLLRVKPCTCETFHVCHPLYFYCCDSLLKHKLGYSVWMRLAGCR